THGYGNPSEPIFKYMYTGATRWNAYRSYVGFQRRNPNWTATNSPQLRPRTMDASNHCSWFHLGSFCWRTGTKPAQSNDGNRSRIGSIYDKAAIRQSGHGVGNASGILASRI